MKFKPDTILLHCGTNDLRTEKSAEEISLSIINLAKKIKSNVNAVSGIIDRNDALNVKASRMKIVSFIDKWVAFKLKWNDRTCKQLFKV